VVVTIQNSVHYLWGGSCEGWRLLHRGDLIVIQERVPAGGAEVMHYHKTARQFFYILEDVYFLVISVPPTAGDRVNL
jgi:hypothetical protein